jgi:hypothetical protein
LKPTGIVAMTGSACVMLLVLQLLGAALRIAARPWR